ncbi:MarR family winged helix-turn-helix transcriptional regulator [Roseibium litorale]|uniref:Winged helix-turn-helix transcriptional regulator n=1 Tax=Roseibium litorale TaxID=2803841 RepID=A0ABR9CIY4_9HYPH|nr:MarR family winged helix-turn-helix transcriptional regulator [Roseibium litorale]MBD8890794.1 winged helix-turn-helix transcriptional regulator [Roseibium litorale]
MIPEVLDPASRSRIDLGGLEQSLGFLLRVSQLKVFHHFFEKLGHIGLKPGEYSVLWVIARNPGIRQGLLAQNLAIKNAHMTKLIRSFEVYGFVERRIPDEDRRAVELSLTEQGEAFVARHKPDFFGYIQTLDSPLDESETRELVRLLAKFSGISRESVQ